MICIRMDKFMIFWFNKLESLTHSVRPIMLINFTSMMTVRTESPRPQYEIHTQQDQDGCDTRSRPWLDETSFEHLHESRVKHHLGFEFVWTHDDDQVHPLMSQWQHVFDLPWTSSRESSETSPRFWIRLDSRRWSKVSNPPTYVTSR